MSIRIAINGFGRIGRCILRALYESGHQNKFTLVAINDLEAVETAAHLIRYDSTHGRFNHKITTDNEHIIIDGQPVQIISERAPEDLPWGAMGVDIVFECTGKFTARQEAMRHIKAGAKKVLISAPGQDADATIVYGVNHELIKPSDLIVSNASCTTNCLAPVAKVLNDNIGIESGLINTVHAYTSDQVLLDSRHIDLRRARSATQSIIPTKTGAASAIGLILPELTGKLDGFALRVPTPNVSVIDLTLISQKQTSKEEINNFMRAAKSNVLQINEEPLVSCDFNHSPASAIFDATQTPVLGKLVKVLAWYDNDWGFSNRMLDTAACMMQ